MKPTIRLQIPTPCHENWNEMTPVEQGRFCNACNKAVVDFSIMTDQQILDHLAKAAGSTCGRVNNTQLLRDIQPMPIPPKTKWWMALAMPLLLFFNRSIAQSTIKAKAATDQQQAPEKRTLKMGKMAPRKVQLSGKVTDAQGAPIAYAVLSISTTQDGTTTNEQGEYSIQLATWADSVVLEVSSLGYFNNRQTIALDNRVTKDVVLEENVNTLKPVTVASYGKVVGRLVMGGVSVMKVDTLLMRTKDTIARLVKQPRFTVAPNPVQRHQQVNVYVKDLDNYSLQVINNSGVVMYTQTYKAAKGITQQITLPSNCIPGLYYVRMVDMQTQKQYTNKLIVL
ncbi:Por secretion system C-terminal sorting domain-containing protein [Filimonas lacunae]|uniref:Por secretion system C-terminal sorting domain-containing protein n=1 Tax=Filimonas lacunae TaxID=477680 RepID=A0A173MAP7_9BACT|nr:carboxypeptidase-like regulatory domain-containing protein [Filimonas lacunae]BAV04538.1 hypothetical protein FLA_0530 [Filimonas lacunae]SIT31735.1 Por secretion system C-terminal sorting domain-containing protein [Filimonas lacunae]